MNNTAIVISDEFKAQLKAFTEDWYAFYKAISQEETPQVDGNSQRIIEKRKDGYDYIIENYMRDCLNKHFPGWSWEGAGQEPIQLIGSEWIRAQGHLIIIDPYLLQLGISPPTRRFFGVDSVRIQYGHGKPHTSEHLVDIGDNAKSANTAALKYAINRLTGIGDDVYGKRTEMEGAGSYETILETTGDASAFYELIAQRKILVSKVCTILKVKDLSEITDYKEAWQKIKENGKQ